MTLIDEVMEELAGILNYNHRGMNGCEDALRQALTPLLTPTGDVGEVLGELHGWIDSVEEDLDSTLTHFRAIPEQLRTHILAMQGEVTDLETKLDEQRDKWAEILADKLFDGDGS